MDDVVAIVDQAIIDGQVVGIRIVSTDVQLIDFIQIGVSEFRNVHQVGSEFTQQDVTVGQFLQGGKESEHRVEAVIGCTHIVLVFKDHPVRIHVEQGVTADHEQGAEQQNQTEEVCAFHRSHVMCFFSLH
jgi:hypothetical protein